MKKSWPNFMVTPTTNSYGHLTVGCHYDAQRAAERHGIRPGVVLRDHKTARTLKVVRAYCYWDGAVKVDVLNVHSGRRSSVLLYYLVDRMTVLPVVELLANK